MRLLLVCVLLVAAGRAAALGPCDDLAALVVKEYARTDFDARADDATAWLTAQMRDHHYLWKTRDIGCEANKPRVDVWGEKHYPQIMLAIACTSTDLPKKFKRMFAECALFREIRTERMSRSLVTQFY